MKWLPIETAPKDGTRVMVFRMHYLEDIAVCFYSNSQKEWVPVNGSVFPSGTHWMPLPPPPLSNPINQDDEE